METYQDERFSIWKSPVFKYAIPASLVLVYFAVSYLVGFFSPDTVDAVPVATVTRVEPVVESVLPFEPVEPVSVVDAVEIEADPVPAPLAFFRDLADRYRLRLAGYVRTDDSAAGYVDFLDGSFHLKERLTFEAILELGFDISFYEFGILLENEDINLVYIVTAWPIDPFGSVSRKTRSDPALTTDADGGAS
jgi:hypothetical protein